MSEVKIEDSSGNILRSYDIGEYHVPTFLLPPRKIKQIVEDVPNFYCRNDDIMLCAFPKTGTNWVYELVMMLMRGSSRRIKYNKVQTMLESTPADMMEEMPSPRILNMHLSPRFLPKDLTRKQIKTILVVRNPKDTAVSYYNHMTGLKAYRYNGNWRDWLDLYIHGKLEYGKYSTYLREWDGLLQGGVKFSLHVIHYEDLHKNCIEEVRRLAEFLDVNPSDSLLREIVDMSSFDQMAQDKFQPVVKDILFKENFQFFRKGKVGDWKNWFTSDQCDLYDSMWAKEMQGSTFKFVYDETEFKSKL